MLVENPVRSTINKKKLILLLNRISQTKTMRLLISNFVRLFVTTVLIVLIHSDILQTSDIEESERDQERGESVVTQTTVATAHDLIPKILLANFQTVCDVLKKQPSKSPGVFPTMAECIVPKNASHYVLLQKISRHKMLQISPR